MTLEAIKLPDVLDKDSPLVPEFLNVLNNAELAPQARAQALLDLHAQVLQEASEKGSKLWSDTQQQWADEVGKDPVVGGDKLAPALGGIAKLIDTYATDESGKPDPAFAAELRQAMDMTGAGNHPKMIRFLHNVASALVKEGGPVPAANPGYTPRSAAEILYPNQGKQ